MADLSKLSDEQLLGMFSGAPSQAPAKAIGVSAMSDEALLNMLDQKPQSKQGLIEGAVDSFTTGAMFNFGDEITAAEAALLGRTPDGDWFDYSEGMGKRFDDALAAERAQNKTFKEENPVLATGAEIAGAIAGPGKFAAGKGAVDTVGRAIASGVVGGGVAGFGAGEDGLTNRLENAGTGAAIGGITAGVMQPVARYGGKALSAIGRKAREKLTPSGPASAAQQRVAKAIADDDLTPQRIAARLDMMGPDATIADVGGKNVKGALRAAASVPGKAKNRSERFLENRNATQYRRVEEATEEALNETGETFYENIDDLMKTRSTAAKPLYDSAVKADNLIPDDEFLDLVSDDFIADTITAVQKKKLYGMEGMTPNSMPVIDAAKKELDDMISVARRAGEGNRVRLLSNKKNRLVELADKHFPDYRRAREAFAGPTQSIEALEEGRKFMKGDIEMTAKKLASLSDNDKAFFRAGVERQIRENIRKAPDTSDVARRIFGTKQKREQLAAVFPSRKAFRAFEKKMLSEMKMSQTRNFVLSGSQTQPRQAEAADFLGDVAMDAATGNSQANIMARLLRGATDYVARPAPTTAQEIGALLLNPVKPQNQELLQRMQREALAEALRNQSTGRAVGAVTTGTATALP